MVHVSAFRSFDSSALFEFPLVTVMQMAEALRAQVRRSVVDRVPIDDVERARIVTFLHLYDGLVDPFDQAGDPVHVTGSAIVVGPRGVVLLRHKRLGIWLQPGGHVDPGESPWDGARREAEEETGLQVRIIGTGAVPRLAHVDVHDGGRGHTHLDLRYLVDGGDRDPVPPVGESQEIGWFAWPEAVERASDERLSALLAHLAEDFRKTD